MRAIIIEDREINWLFDRMKIERLDDVQAKVAEISGLPADKVQSVKHIMHDVLVEVTKKWFREQGWSG